MELSDVETSKFVDTSMTLSRDREAVNAFLGVLGVYVGFQDTAALAELVSPNGYVIGSVFWLPSHGTLMSGVSSDTFRR